MTIPRIALGAVAALLAASSLVAQHPDSVAQLPELTVTVSRTDLPVGLAGLSATILRGDSARRGRPTATLDDVLGFVPGVLARTRTDPTLDTRITMRGAGARANFGVRGVRVLIDGVPATLPDGQTPLSAIDLQLAQRIEIARGPLAAAHGNGSQGVLSIHTPGRLDGPFDLRTSGTADLSTTAGRHGRVVFGGSRGALGGLVAASRSVSEGWRQHSRSEQLRLRASAEWQAAAATSLTLRGHYADDPDAESPGALTLVEFGVDPTAAAPNSLARNAGKSVRQRDLSIALTHRTGAASVEATTWVVSRSLTNPLAAPAPAPTAATEGVWVGIERQVVGARTAVRRALHPRLAVTAGLDAQRMVDDRVNRRHDAAVVSGPAFLDQREVVAELGPFAQAAAFLGRNLVARGGVRYDRVTFDVTDRRDPAAGGQRTMAAWSGNGAFALSTGATESWIGVGSAFETPTTTELANRPDGSTGINRDLEPSRTVSVEAGIRLRSAHHQLELVGFVSRTREAIAPVAEEGGRSYFANVGETRSRGLELAAASRLIDGVIARAAVTVVRARFGPGSETSAGAMIEGHHLPGVIPVAGRLGITGRSGRFTLDLDQAWSASVYADDGNTVRVPGWGVGITNLLLAAHLGDRGNELTLGASNLFDRRHATGVVVNGGFGRVVEPGSGRVVRLGVTVRAGPVGLP
jgi:iron complex outermembrane receptor protein